jgi:hypothetical protein
MDNFKPMSVQALRKRGHCCKSACLHCPYGFTLKKHGLKFCPTLEFETQKLNNQYLKGDQTYIVTLKGCPCASIRVNHILVTEFLLFDEFEEQGITKEVVESYFFY